MSMPLPELVMAVRYRAGASTLKLADDFVIGDATVRDILKKWGVTMRKPGRNSLAKPKGDPKVPAVSLNKLRTGNAARRMIDAYLNSEASVEEIAGRFGVSPGTVRRYAAYAGVARRPPKDGKIKVLQEVLRQPVDAPEGTLSDVGSSDAEQRQRHSGGR